MFNDCPSELNPEPLALEPVKSAEDLFDMVQELAQVGTWSWNIQHNNVTWSKQLFEIFGISEQRESASFEAYLERIHPEERESSRRVIEQALQNKSEFAHKERIIRSTGEERLLSCRGRVLLDAHGNPEYLVGVCMDITEREKLSRSAKLTNRLAGVGQLAAGVAHELNNPLTYAHQAVHELEEQWDSLDKNGQQLLRDLSIGIERMSTIVSDLKILSRPNLPDVGGLSLARVTESAVRLAANELRHRASVEMRLDPKVKIRGSDAKIGQVLMNLIANSAQAMSEQTAGEQKLHIRVRQDEQFGYVEVEDNGKGLPVADPEVLFSPFYTTREESGGTGLGLHICRRICQELGGTVTLHRLPQGTRACMSLPLEPYSEDSAAPKSIPPSSGARQKRLRILIVDDDHLVQRALNRMLKGFDVVTLSSGQELLAFADRIVEFDLVICDLMMPALSGSQTLLELERLNTPGLERFVFLTGGALTDETLKFLENAKHPILEKPISTRNLLELISTFSENAQVARP